MSQGLVPRARTGCTRDSTGESGMCYFIFFTKHRALYLFKTLYLIFTHLVPVTPIPP